MVTKRETCQGGINQKFGINVLTLLYIKRTNMDLPYSTGNSMFCNDDLYAEKKTKKNEYMYMCK